MKKIFLIVLILIGWSDKLFAQEFALTSNGFVNIIDGKSYYVANIDEMTQQQLYMKAKSYFTTIYNSPKEVMSEVENEQIVINAITSDYIVVVFNPAQSNMWHFRYSFKINFRDNQIRIEPQFLSLDNLETGGTVDLYRLFNKKGEIKKPKAVDFVNNRINYLTSDFISSILEEEEW